MAQLSARTDRLLVPSSLVAVSTNLLNVSCIEKTTCFEASKPMSGGPMLTAAVVLLLQNTCQTLLMPRGVYAERRIEGDEGWGC